LAHGKEKCSPQENYQCLNVSFPGLNQDVDPIEERLNLMEYFKQMAE